MTNSSLIDFRLTLFAGLMIFFAYFLGKHYILYLNGHKRTTLKDLPHHYGLLTALTCGLPVVLLTTTWLLANSFVMEKLVAKQHPEIFNELSSEVRKQWLRNTKHFALYESNQDLIPNKLKPAVDYYRSTNNQVFKLVTTTLCAVALVVLASLFPKFTTRYSARSRAEVKIQNILRFCAFMALVTTISILFTIIYEAVIFFQQVPFWEFISGKNWQPHSAKNLPIDPSHFGALPLFVGTFFITLLAMILALPVGIFTAIYLSEYASYRKRSLLKPCIESLAGVPTIVYGFFAALVIGPSLHYIGQTFGVSIHIASALTVSLVMAIMITPYIVSLTDDAIRAVPKELRESSLGLGATPAETITKVVLPTAMPGIMSGILLAISRSIGETMVVLMAGGLIASLSFDPTQPTSNITAQIVSLMTGDQSFDHPKTLAAFALGLTLFAFTLILNLFAISITKRYKA